MSKGNGVSGTAVGVGLAGAVFLYSGIKGSGISETIRGFLSGNLPSGSGFEVTGTDGSTVSGSGAAAAVSAAESQIGKPYRWGTPLSASDPNPKTFDCSGLTMWAYKRGGVTLPHLASGQAATLRHKDFSDKQPGDLIFYGIVPHHVAMYVGDNTVVEAPDVGIPVRRRTLQYDSTDRQNYVGAFPARATTSPNPVNAGNTTQTGNRGLAQIMAASYGWVGDQWSTLQKLWDRESGFNNYAKNPTSGAYGIAQALPESKYPYAGTEAGGSSARAQISWGLSYIKTRYGTPAAAWSHEQSAGWY